MLISLRKINTAPQTSETLGKELLTYYGDTFITDPPMQKVTIKIGVGIELKVSKVSKGVKVKDVVDVIYTKYGKKFVSSTSSFSIHIQLLTIATEVGRPRIPVSHWLHMGRR